MELSQENTIGWIEADIPQQLQKEMMEWIESTDILKNPQCSIDLKVDHVTLIFGIKQTDMKWIQQEILDKNTKL